MLSIREQSRRSRPPPPRAPTVRTTSAAKKIPKIGFASIHVFMWIYSSPSPTRACIACFFPGYCTLDSDTGLVLPRSNASPLSQGTTPICGSVLLFFEAFYCFLPPGNRRYPSDSFTVGATNVAEDGKRETYAREQTHSMPRVSRDHRLLRRR